jgi:hypothetical protein
VSRKGWLLFGQIAEALPALLFCWVPQKRSAGSGNRGVAAAFGRPDGVWSSTTAKLSSASSTHMTRNPRSLPGLAGHSRNTMADAVRRHGAWKRLERRDCGVLQVGHVSSPEVVVHFLCESSPQFQLLGGTRLFLHGQRRARLVVIGLERSRAEGVSHLLLRAGTAAPPRHNRVKASSRRQRRIREAAR